MNEKFYKNTYIHTPSPIAQENWVYINAVGHYRHEADVVPFYRDYADGYQLFYTVSGKGWLDYEGSIQQINPSTIMCVDLSKRHGFGSLPGEIWEHYWVICTGKLFETLYNTIFQGINLLTPSNSSYAFELIKGLYDLKNSDYIYYDLKAMSNIINILTLLLPYKGQKGDNGINPHHECVERAILYIRQNYSADIDLENLSTVSGYSRYHFSRIFKKHTGFSPVDYIIKTRLETAKHALCTSDLSIEMIAQQSGFSSINYFIKVFKKWEGITPFKYRKLPRF